MTHNPPQFDFSQSLGLSLDKLPLRQSAVVSAVAAPADSPEWAQWLTEIGFIPGEPVEVLAKGMPGSDPLVVRVGDSTFALRRAEAACIQLASQIAQGRLKAAA
ncbi:MULTISPECIES: FeoA family protein [Limnobacter]|uniref:Ferrous iron transporter FeoA-like domain-containing protein n=1 Tax=Limnobacter litoralis TaxID=481366 RepID=A0ABQ5YQ75_9BURK|nr:MULTISPECIES: FeoA family protein [Limnobacter]GLR26754.1 hypothetical protein GCM10007875_18440 [Limnobacter litoralis]HEX5485682.1 FeoA family protein [Limnobacter sp.]